LVRTDRAFPLALTGWILCLVALAGCGGGGGKEAAPAGPVEITLWEMMDPPERALLAEHLAAFEAAHPGVTVSTTHLGVEDVRSQFLTAALGGGGPDVVYGPSDQIGPLSVAGTLRPAEEVFGADFLEPFHPLTREELHGHYWAVPEQFGNHLLLVYNKAFVTAPPADTDELIRVAKRNTIDENGDGTPERYGLAFETKEPFWLVPWLGGFGGWVMDDDSRPTLDSPAMARALGFVRDLKTLHKILPRDCDYELADTLFREGRVAFLINGPWSWSAYRAAGIDIGLAPLPKITEVDAWPSPMVSFRGYSVSKSCPESRLPKVRELVLHLTSAAAQGELASRIGALPSLLELQGPAVDEDPTLGPSMEQVRHGRKMPIVPEMRAIWDAMRPSFQNVMNGEATPEQAAKAMQADALRKIAEMQG
jgi:maltose-binding protein MalE